MTPNILIQLFAIAGFSVSQAKNQVVNENIERFIEWLNSCTCLGIVSYLGEIVTWAIVLIPLTIVGTCKDSSRNFIIKMSSALDGAWGIPFANSKI